MKTDLPLNPIMQQRLDRYTRRGKSWNRDQLRFLQIAGITSLFSAVWFIVGKHTFTFTPEAWATYPDRLAFLMRTMVFVSLPLLLGILAIAIQRLDPRNVIGQRLKTDTPADINKRYLSNTIEQILIFFFVHAALIYYMPKEEAISLILLASLFIVGRLIFWVGYHRDRFTRAIGFGITFYPILGAYIWIIIRMVFGIHIPL